MDSNALKFSSEYGIGVFWLVTVEIFSNVPHEFPYTVVYFACSSTFATSSISMPFILQNVSISSLWVLYHRIPDTILYTVLLPPLRPKPSPPFSRYWHSSYCPTIPGTSHACIKARISHSPGFRLQFRQKASITPSAK